MLTHPHYFYTFLLNPCIHTFKKYAFIFLVSFNLASCNQADTTPPTVDKVLVDYIDVLKTGDLKRVERTYFMPLHWRQKEKIFKEFNRTSELVKQGKLTLKFIDVKQKGRWALSILEETVVNNNKENTAHNAQVWFFYYDGRWQVVSPYIFKTAPVRAMMDLYREQNELRLWYENEQLNK